MSYNVYKVTPDLAVRKSTGAFSASIGTSTGVASWDFGNGQTVVSNTPYNIYDASESPPFLINIINEEVNNFVTSLNLSSNELTAIDICRYAGITNLDISNNLLNSAQLNETLIQLDSFGKLFGSFDYSNNPGSPDTLEAQDAYNSLISKGWVITGDAPFERFIFTVDTAQAGTSASDQFTLPLTTGTYDLEIDWGDGGIVENYIGTSAITHTFPLAGIYTVSIKKNTWSGSMIFNGGGDRLKLISITQFSTQITFNNTSGMFSGCSNLNISSEVGMKFSSNDFTRIFRNCFSLNIEDFNSWDTSIVTNMNAAFQGCTNFNGNIDQWDVSSVTSMNLSFTDARDFNGLIGGWNTSSLTAMTQMFQGAINFNQPIGEWNTSNVTNMTGIFTNATNFNQPIGTWNTSSATSMIGMFRNAISFDQPIGNWNVSSVANMSQMFRGASAFDQSIGNWDVTSVTNMSNMFTDATLSTGNYDSLLVGWESQNVQNNVNFSGGNSKYTLGSAAEAARQRLITDHNWSITDGGSI